MRFLQYSASACLLAAAPAVAQDSVSIVNAPPGDAIEAYDTGEQTNDFVVELTPFQSSWGNGFGITPLIKASEDLDVNPLFFTHGMSGQAISRDMLAGVPFLRNSYDDWTGLGFGIHPTNSVQGASVDTSALVGSQFAAGFAEFGGQSNNIITGIANFENSAPSRLYVSRIVTATNSTDYLCNLAQFGFGSVDADGNTAWRADDFGVISGCGTVALGGNNLFRVDAAARGSVVNFIGNLSPGDPANTTRVVSSSADVHISPNLVPNSIAGRPIIISNNFNSQFVYEAVAGSPTYTTSYLPPGTPNSRGSIAYFPGSFTSLFGASNVNGTAGVLGYEDNPFNPTEQLALSLTVFGLTSNGGVAGTLKLPLPTVITDNDSGFATNAGGPGLPSFIHYWSQVSFRGANSQVSIGQDQAGRLMAAAVLSHPETMGNPGADSDNAIAVARVTSTGMIEWTLAAHNDGTTGAGGTGKAIEDGSGNVVGRLISIFGVTGGALAGPSQAPPMIDSVGNVWFLGGIETFAAGDTDVALLRAVYDPATFSYKLEKVLEVGEVFLGQKSNTEFQIRFMAVADSNSLSSQAAFSNNITAGAYNHIDPTTLSTSDSRTLGGLVLSASIIYDADGDGDFESQTGNNPVPGSSDQDYTTLIYISAADDCNNNGVADDIDIADNTSVDLNVDGVPDECAGSIGSNFCVSLPNSTNQPATIAGNGSDSVSNNDVTLIAGPVGVNVPGIFYYGGAQIQQPFGDGFRCVAAGGVGVFRLPFENGGPNGVLIHDLNIASPPNPNGQIAAGSTWNFQSWFRDPTGPGGTGFNLSDGLSVTFTP